MQLILAFLLAGLIATPSETTFWQCFQVGHTGDNTPVLAITDIQTNEFKDTGKREKRFIKAVKKLLKLADAYPPICIDFKSANQAVVAEERLLEKARDIGLTLIWIPFDIGEKDGFTK